MLASTDVTAKLESGSGDYTEERRDLLDGTTIDDFAARIRRCKAPGNDAE